MEFALPAGVDREMVRKSLDKLRTNTGNEFVQLLPSPDPATAVLDVSRRDPMPQVAELDGDVCGRDPDQLPLGVGVDGSVLVWDVRESNSLLVSGAPGMGKSAALRNPVTEALRRGWLVCLADPIKAAADFRYAAGKYTALAASEAETEVLLRELYREVCRRRDLNGQHGAPSYRDLPDGIRPPHVLLVIDEFNNLLQLEQVESRPSLDPEVEADRLARMAVNDVRRSIGMLTGKIIREARSAGVSVLLAGQQIYADDLRKAGAGNLKPMMAALVLGNPSLSVLQGVLRSPEDAPRLAGEGEVLPKGRGLFESSSSPAVAIQCFFADPAGHAALVSGVRDAEGWDLRPSRPVDESPPVEEVSAEDLFRAELSFDLALEDLDAVAGSGPAPDAEPGAVPVPKFPPPFDLFADQDGPGLPPEVPPAAAGLDADGWVF
jgi:hypothetical protein